MNIEKAVEILELHNKWRRDNDGKYEMAEPKELGKAIDLVVSEFKNWHLQRVSQRSELLIDFLIHLNDKGLINNHDFDYEKEAKKYYKKSINCC
jgi:hypothetical protein